MATTTTNADRPDEQRLFGRPGEAEADLIGTRSLGFTLYLLGDVIIYAALFAAYSVLDTHFAGGPTSKTVVHPLHAFGESILLYVSAWMVGMAMWGLARGEKILVSGWLALAAVFGCFFIAFEIYDFNHAVSMGITPQVSGYLSIYFVLVGIHGLHILAGVIWMLLMIVQIGVKDLTTPVVSRLVNLKLFWMFQSAMWACVFTFVYLLGVV